MKGKAVFISGSFTPRRSTFTLSRTSAAINEFDYSLPWQSSFTLKKGVLYGTSEYAPKVCSGRSLCSKSTLTRTVFMCSLSRQNAEMILSIFIGFWAAGSAGHRPRSHGPEPTIYIYIYMHGIRLENVMPFAQFPRLLDNTVPAYGNPRGRVKSRSNIGRYYPAFRLVFFRITARTMVFQQWRSLLGGMYSVYVGRIGSSNWFAEYVLVTVHTQWRNMHERTQYHSVSREQTRYMQSNAVSSAPLSPIKAENLASSNVSYGVSAQFPQ